MGLLGNILKSPMLIGVLIIYIVLIILISELALVPYTEKNPDGALGPGGARGIMAVLGIAGLFIVPIVAGKFIFSNDSVDSVVDAAPRFGVRKAAQLGDTFRALRGKPTVQDYGF